MSDNIGVDIQKDPTSSTADLEDSHSHEPNAYIRPDENATLSEAMSRFEAATCSTVTKISQKGFMAKMLDFWRSLMFLSDHSKVVLCCFFFLGISLLVL